MRRKKGGVVEKAERGTVEVFLHVSSIRQASISDLTISSVRSLLRFVQHRNHGGGGGLRSDETDEAGAGRTPGAASPHPDHPLLQERQEPRKGYAMPMTFSWVL